jgi:hypothetical protein
MKVVKEQLRVGQVLEEDDEFVTLKVAKGDQAKYEVEDGDKFWTLLFVQPDGDDMKAEFPWNL